MRALRLSLTAVAALVAYLLVMQRPYAMSIVAKAAGRQMPCPWSKLLAAPWDLEQLTQLRAATRSRIQPLAEDKQAGLRQFATPHRPFWLRDSGRLMDAPELLAYVLAEQAWLARIAPEHMVRPGDVVMDVGAHVGTFGDEALRRGAAKVIMIEPDPGNGECIRRNFAKEIAAGKVLLIPAGAWDKEGSLEFTTGVANSGTGSFVVAEEIGSKIKVRVRPIDAMLAEFGIAKVDFVKMDIEGAERQALRGAAQMLARSKPRLMLDAYHLPDDDAVLPQVIRAANAGYRDFCAACAPSRHVDQHIAPYAIFFY